MNRKPDPNDVWYSAEIGWYSVADEWGDHAYSVCHMVMSEYVVVRTTPKGVWLRGFLTGEFFVKGTALRQRAVPTKELALQDLVARQERHVLGCEARLRRANESLGLALTELQKHVRPHYSMGKRADRLMEQRRKKGTQTLAEVLG